MTCNHLEIRFYLVQKPPSAKRIQYEVKCAHYYHNVLSFIFKKKKKKKKKKKISINCISDHFNADLTVNLH